MATIRSNSRRIETLSMIFALVCLLAGFLIGQLHAAESAVATPPLPAAYFAELAEVKQRYKLFAEARELYGEAIGRAANEQEKSQYQIRLAETLDGAGEDATAIWQTLAQSRNPSVVYRAKVALAAALAKDGKKTEAVALLEEIAIASPIQAYRAAAATQLAKLADKATKLPEYKERLAKEPKNKELLNLVLALQANDAAGRSDTLAIVYQADPHDLDVMQRYGQSLVDAGKIAAAEKFYSDMRSNYPSLNRDACAQLARLKMQKGDAPAAAELIKQSAADLPDDIQKSLYLTRECLALGLYDQAAQYGREADARAQGETMKAAVGMELGDALYHLKQYDEALALLKPLAEQSLWGGLKARAQGIVASISTQVRQ